MLLVPVEGPYRRATGNATIWPYFFLNGLLWIVLIAAIISRPESDPRPATTIRYNPSLPVESALDLRPDLDDIRANLRALAKRVERPAVYRYLDPKPLKLRASRFADPGDKLTGSSSACKLPDDYRRVLPTDYVYAHRDWPCHQLAEICYRGKCVRAIKGTSGPFGCVLKDGAEPFKTCQGKGRYTWCWTTRAREDCEYRGQIDLGAAVANALGMEGIKTVRVRRIKE